MSINNNKQGLSIFTAINDKEKKIFDRVITFNQSHGQTAHYCDQIAMADIIVCDAHNIPDTSQLNSPILVVITDDKTLGDIQIAPPLLITRVMKAMENATKLAESNTQKNSGSSLNNEETAPVAKTEIQATPEETQTKQYHALVIDDSASIRKQLELELRDAGISTDFAESGEQALEKIKETQFDLVFLDIIMPGMDGYETCKAMRATIEYKKTPIIMLSGKSSPLDEVEGVIAGATCYLIKPVKSDMLQQTLNRVTKWIDNFSETQKSKPTEATV